MEEFIMEKIINLFNGAVEVAKECNCDVYGDLTITRNHFTRGVRVSDNKYASNILLVSSLIGLIKYTEQFLRKSYYSDDYIGVIRDMLHTIYDIGDSHILDICNNKDIHAIDSSIQFVIKNVSELKAIISPSLYNDTLNYVKETLVTLIFINLQMLVSEHTNCEDHIRNTLLSIPYIREIKAFIDSSEVTGFSNDDNMRYVALNAHSIKSLHDEIERYNDDADKTELKDMVETLFSYAKSAMESNNLSIHDIVISFISNIYFLTFKPGVVSTDTCYNEIKKLSYCNITNYADIYLNALESHMSYERLLPKFIECLMTSLVVAVDCKYNKI